MSDSPVLGIDLGTTNSVVSYVREDGEVRTLRGSDGSYLIPSVISFHPSGSVVVGADGRERRLLDSRNTVFSTKRLIGRPFDSPEVRRAKERFPFEMTRANNGGVLVQARGETYTLAELSAFVLREVRAVAEKELQVPCRRAVITVPANFNELQRSATKAAGRVAGLDVLRILNEPTAAALAYGYGEGNNERVVIFDLGGGTFDVTVLELANDVFEVLATAGDTYLGGDDFDSLIAEQMAEAFLAHHRYDPRGDAQAYERLRAAGEWAKCQLSHQKEVQLRIEELAYGDGGASLDLTFGMTRKGLEALAMPLLARAFDVCEEALSVAGLRPQELDNVILVGGSTRMPLVHRMVTEYFGKKPLTHVDPDIVVAQGAAIQGRILASARAKSAIGRVALRKITKVGGGIQESNVAQHRDLTGPLNIPPTSAAVVGGGAASALDDIFDDAPAVATLQKPSAQNPGLPPPPPPRAPTPPPPPPPPPAPAPAPVPDLPSLDDTFDPLAFDPAPEPPAPPPIEPARPPLLLDVTPLSLGVETVSGFCERIIARNSPIPTEQTRVFSTGMDDQSEVVIRICQGESRRLEENQELGAIELTDLRPAARGAVQIEVTFILDADGTLQVRAVDLKTGKRQQIRVQLVGATEEGDFDEMQARLEEKMGG